MITISLKKFILNNNNFITHSSNIKYGQLFFIISKNVLEKIRSF